MPLSTLCFVLTITLQQQCVTCRSGTCLVDRGKFKEAPVAVRIADCFSDRWQARWLRVGHEVVIASI